MVISENIIKLGGTKRSASAQPPGSSKLKKARSSTRACLSHDSTRSIADLVATALIPSNLGNPPAIYSHPLTKTLSAPIPAAPPSFHSHSISVQAPSPVHSATTLPTQPIVTRKPLPVYSAASASSPHAGRESDRADTDSSDEEDVNVAEVKPVLAKRPNHQGGSNGNGKHGHHPLSRHTGLESSSGSDASGSDDSG